MAYQKVQVKKSGGKRPNSGRKKMDVSERRVHFYIYPKQKDVDIFTDPKAVKAKLTKYFERLARMERSKE